MEKIHEFTELGFTLFGDPQEKEACYIQFVMVGDLPQWLDAMATIVLCHYSNNIDVTDAGYIAGLLRAAEYVADMYDN